MIGHIYPDFNTLMNKSILIEEERNKTKRDRKRKFLIQCARQPKRTQCTYSNNLAPSKYQTTMQYRTPRSSSQQVTSNFQNNNGNNGSNNNNSNGYSKTNNTNSQEVCIRCRQPGHRVAQCPYPTPVNSTLAQSVASNRIAASRTGRFAPQNSGPPKQNAQNFGQGRVNHVSAKEVQAAPVLCTVSFL